MVDIDFLFFFDKLLDNILILKQKKFQEKKTRILSVKLLIEKVLKKRVGDFRARVKNWKLGLSV